MRRPPLHAKKASQPGSRQRGIIRSLLAVLLLSTAQIVPAFATIDNSATANGTYNSAPVQSPASNVSVPVENGSPSLSVVATAGAPVDTTGDGVIGPGDKFTMTYTITNTGNVTITSVVPVHSSTTFNTVAGTGSIGAFSPASATITPGNNQVYTADYTLTAADAYRAAGINENTGNAVETSVSATGTPASGSLAAVTPSTDEIEIPATAKLALTKSWAFANAGDDADSDGKADKDDIITYTYTVTNTGNVVVADVSIDDTHEGSTVATGATAGTITDEDETTPGVLAAGTDAGIDGSWDSMPAGAVITFTYVHTVTQTEVDGG